MKKFAIAAGLALMVGATGAQAHGEYPGYATHETEGYVITNGEGDCWRTPNWTPESVGCGDMSMAAEVKYVNVDATKRFALYFDFDSTEVGRVANIVDYIGGLSYLQAVNLVGHADRLGSDSYNQDLSERRAQAVAVKLSEAGVSAEKISMSGMGESAPVANCTGSGAELIACLRPDRRVDVEVVGETTVKETM